MCKKKNILVIVVISLLTILCSINTVSAESLDTWNEAWLFVPDHGLRPFSFNLTVDEDWEYMGYYANANSHDCTIWGYPGYHNLSAGLWNTDYKLYSYPSGSYIRTEETLYSSDYTPYSIIYPDDGRSYFLVGLSDESISNNYSTTTLKSFYNTYLTVPDAAPGIASFENMVYVYR